MSEEKQFTVEQVRGAYGHRAEWLYFLSKTGLADEQDDGPLHQAIRACGHLHGHRKFGETSSLQEFAEVFRSSPAREVFDMQTNVLNDELFEVEFHTCPLVKAWRELGLSDEEVSLLCDIAMDGDRGIIEELGTYSFELPETIADGHERCLIRIGKRDHS